MEGGVNLKVCFFFEVFNIFPIGSYEIPSNQCKLLHEALKLSLTKAFLLLLWFK